MSESAEGAHAPTAPSQSAATLRRRAIAAAVAPGVLAGIHLANLLFFLNPHLPFSPRTLAATMALYAPALGLFSLLLHAPWLRQPTRVLRALPWTLTLVLALTVVAAWGHAALYAYDLPPGINRRLLRLGVWVGITAVVGFYTALLHRARRRPYGIRSRVLYTALALASIYAAFERREAFDPTAWALPRATTIPERPPLHLAVVGLEGASLDAVLPLVEEGRLPFFARLRDDGWTARMQPQGAPVRAARWTSIATGKHPFRHGIVGARRWAAPSLGPDQHLLLLPRGLGFRWWGTWPLGAVDARDRRALPLWTILSRLNLPTAVIGWPLITPTDPAVRTVVPEPFFEGAGDLQAPTGVAERLRLYRRRLDEIGHEATARFGRHPDPQVLSWLALDLWRESLALSVVEPDVDAQALFVTLPGLASLSAETYGGFAAVRDSGTRTPATERAAQLLSAYYEHLDDFLARLWERLPPPRLLVVTSASGAGAPAVHPRTLTTRAGWRALRARLGGPPPVGGTVDGRADGLLMMLGEGVRARGEEAAVGRAHPVDLAPTLLYAVGLPVANDADGDVLTDAFDEAFLARRALTFVPSYDVLDAGAPPPR
ncbi:MAG: alkaline phosphatase family protein [Acidobacteriota bacterium]